MIPIYGYWDEQKVVPKARNYFGRLFHIDRGVTQGYPVSRMIFNIVLDAVVRAVLLEVCGPQEAHHGFGWATGKHNIVLYVEEMLIVMRNPIWVQTTLTATLIIFERVVIQKNLGNTKAMVFTPGFLWGQQGGAAYKRRATGEGANFREQILQLVDCPVEGRPARANNPGRIRDKFIYRH